MTSHSMTSAQDLFPSLETRTVDQFSCSYIMCSINLGNGSHCNTPTHLSGQIKGDTEAYAFLCG